MVGRLVALLCGQIAKLFLPPGRPGGLSSGRAAVAQDGRCRPDGRLLVDRSYPRPRRAADRSQDRVNLHRRTRKNVLDHARGARNSVFRSVRIRSLCFAKLTFISWKARALSQSCTTRTVLAQHRTQSSCALHPRIRSLTGYHSTHTTPRRISGEPACASRRTRAD